MDRCTYSAAVDRAASGTEHLSFHHFLVHKLPKNYRYFYMSLAAVALFILKNLPKKIPEAPVLHDCKQHEQLMLSLKT